MSRRYTKGDTYQRTYTDLFGGPEITERAVVVSFRNGILVTENESFFTHQDTGEIVWNPGGDREWFDQNHCSSLTPSTQTFDHLFTLVKKSRKKSTRPKAGGAPTLNKMLSKSLGGGR